MHAKIKNGTVLKYPYTIGSLLEENPSTNFGDIADIVAVYASTEDAQKTGATLVAVELGPIPQCDPETQSFRPSKEPVYENGKWVIHQIVYDLTPDQIYIKNNPHKAMA